ncbi:mobile genetic element [Streptococcus pneumoniae]|nr:mobile genetic element [Streptococcus pneumoniae]CAG5309882.1 mobile genetic element [Streptococcus pneumoniae]CAG5315203.1 mobile genetic element [Streptococcus pneumoniae]CAG5450547.1 mobile genetic element [Streptococcus pneumoniae]CAG5639103.1 mobile genetic element [Streptococcus pneumoniae]
MDLKFEGVDLEYKKAKNNLPESFWETYSAFANTNGGKIILGIDEKKTLTPTKE